MHCSFEMVFVHMLLACTLVANNDRHNMKLVLLYLQLPFPASRQHNSISYVICIRDMKANESPSSMLEDLIAWLTGINYRSGCYSFSYAAWNCQRLIGRVSQWHRYICCFDLSACQSIGALRRFLAQYIVRDIEGIIIIFFRSGTTYIAILRSFYVWYSILIGYCYYIATPVYL